MLRELLEKYKKLTIYALKEEDIEEVYSNIEKREEIIKELKQGNYSKHDYKELLNELDIINLDNSLGLKLQQERVNIRHQINNLQQRKNATASYGNNINLRNLFSTKI